MTRPPVIDATFDHDDTGPLFRVSPLAIKACEAYFAYGERYRLEEVDEVQRGRDQAFHANLRSLYETLPEGFSKTITNYDSFRGYCLCRTEHCFTRVIPCGSAKQAKENVPIIQAIMAGRGFAIVTAQDENVLVNIPHSQSLKSHDMDKETRYKSYLDVIDYAIWLVQEVHRRMPAETERQRRMIKARTVEREARKRARQQALPAPQGHPND